MIEDKITWLGHASFRIEVDKTIYIDPWKIRNAAKKADIILISHSHYDHYSVADIKKLATEKTAVITPADCAWKGKGTHTVLAPGAQKKIGSIMIKTLPAYNENKAFHPKQNKWMGFYIETQDGSIYYSGDTDVIAEMQGLEPDVALLPIGGTYTMNAEDAVRAAKLIGAAIVIPYHFGDIVGSPTDAQYLKEKCETVTIIKEVQQ